MKGGGEFLKWNSSIVLSIAPARWTTFSVFSGILWILQTGVFHPLGLVFIYFSGRHLIDLKFKWEPLNRTRTTLRECLFAGASQNAPITQLHLISYRLLHIYKYWHTRNWFGHLFTCKESHKEGTTHFYSVTCLHFKSYWLAHTKQHYLLHVDCFTIFVRAFMVMVMMFLRARAFSCPRWSCLRIR